MFWTIQRDRAKAVQGKTNANGIVALRLTWFKLLFVALEEILLSGFDVGELDGRSARDEFVCAEGKVSRAGEGEQGNIVLMRNEGREEMCDTQTATDWRRGVVAGRTTVLTIICRSDRAQG